MRFLLLNQFYPPDVAPTGQYLHDLARMLVERGHSGNMGLGHRFTEFLTLVKSRWRTEIRGQNSRTT